MIIKQSECKIDKPFKYVGKGKLILTDKTLKFKKKLLFVKNYTPSFEYFLRDIISVNSKRTGSPFTELQIFVLDDEKESEFRISFETLSDSLSIGPLPLGTGPQISVAKIVQEWVNAIGEAKEGLLSSKKAAKESPALDILKERFARGEITKRDFLKKKRLLQE